MQWTISRQILAGYAFSLLLLLVLGGLTHQVTVDLVESTEKRRQTTFVLSQVGDVLSLTQDAETGQRGFLLTGRATYLEPYTEAVNKLPLALNDLRRLLKDNDHEADFDSLKEKVEAKVAELQETIDLAKEGRQADALALVNSNRGKEVMDSIRKTLADISATQVQLQEAFNAEAKAAAHRLDLVIIAGIPIGAVAMILIGLLTARSISRPVSEISHAAQNIAQGDLNVKVPQSASAWEVRALASSFVAMIGTLRKSAALSEKLAAGDLTVQVVPVSEADVVGKSQADMVAKLSSLIEQVQRSGVQVNSSAIQIAASSKEQQSTAGEMASTTTEISTTAKEMSATSTELLKAADNVNAVSQQLAGLASSGKEGLTRMEHVMRQIMDASSSITSRLGEMNDKAGNISSVVTTITKIADQTNLLSLNAAIEAEKAGEYGRGFSVVASEIRRLADQTAASTLDIEQMVKDMLGSVSAGVMGMDKFSEEVRRSAREVSEVSRQIDQMIEQVQSLAPSVESVYEGMRAQTQGSSQISEALSQLGDAARQTADVIRDSNRAVEQLNEATHGLQEIIARFKLR